MKMMRPALISLSLALVLIGCATRKEPIACTAPDRFGTTELENIQAPYEPPPEGTTFKARPKEIPSLPYSQPLPEYPDTALSAEVNCTARLLYHTETDGMASLVRLEWDIAPPDEYLPAFEKAIRNAIADWKFQPAFKITPTQMPDGSIEPVLKPIRYAGRAIIRFRVEAGRGVVE